MIDELMIKYGILYGNRYTNKKKMRFIKQIIIDFKELNYESKLVVKKIGHIKAMNLMVGDVANARHIIVVNYDTPKLLLKSKGRYVFFNKDKVIYNTLIAFLFFIIGFILMTISSLLKLDSIFKVESLFIILGIILCGIGSLYFIIGVGNKYNFKCNSASIVVALQLALKYQGKDIAFVLTDYECTNHLGDQMLCAALPISIDKRSIIHLSSLAEGDKLNILTHKRNKHDFEKRYKIKDNIIYLDDDSIINHSLYFYKRGISLVGGSYLDGDVFLENSGSSNDVSYNAQFMDSAINRLIEIIM